MISTNSVKFMGCEWHLKLAHSEVKTCLVDSLFQQGVLSLLLFFMYNNAIIRFGFCHNWNNQGRGKCYQPKPISQKPHLIIV